MKTRSKKAVAKRSRKAQAKFAALIMSLITCGSDCDPDLPAVSFADCDPVTNESQIKEIRLGKKTATDFSNWDQLSEWTTRLSQTDTSDDALRPIKVVADKPKPETTKKTISGNREIVTAKKHTINFDIDESNLINHNFVRGTKCIDTVKFWYVTLSNKLFGGNTGITATLEVDMTLSRNQGDIQMYQGTLTWYSKDLEEMCDDPVAG